MHHQITHRTNCRVVIAIALTVSLWGCGGGGGGGNPPAAPTPPPPTVTNNLKMAGIEVLTPDPRIAYPLAVSVSIAAVEATDNVGVSLFAIADNADPNAEIRQFPLGTETIARTEAGTHSYDLAVNIPSSVEIPGAYFIAAVVDPVETIAETDEADNTVSVKTMLSAGGGPNILLKEVALDRAVLDIDTRSYAEQVAGDTDNVHNADAGGTITVGADGLVVGETIELEGFATLRMTRSDRGTTHDVPLYLWNSDAGRYMNAYGVDPSGAVLPAPEWLPLGEFAPQLVSNTGGEVALDDLNRDSAHMNFYVPGRLGKELENAMRYASDFSTNSTEPTVPPPDLTAQAIDSLRSFLSSLPRGSYGDEAPAMAVMSFAICVKIRPADPAIVDRVLDDNEVCSPLSISLPPISPTPVMPPPVSGFTPHFSKASEPLQSGEGFDTKAGGSAFAFGLDFGGSSSADYRGYIEEVHGRLPVTVFGVNFDYLRVDSHAQLIPDYAGKPADERSGFTLEYRHLGQMLYSVDIPTATSSPAVSISFSKEAPDPEKPYQAFIGPVPVIGGASVGGNIGVEYEITFTGDPIDGYAIGPSLSPFVNIEALVYAGVGNPLFSAGVEGVLTLLDERVVFFGGTEIDVLDDGFKSGIAEFVIAQGFKITNEFTGPQGAINLYAKYSVPGFKTCNWGVVKGKCPSLVTLKAIKNIWRSKALFKFRDVLLHITGAQLDVVAMQGQDPAYYVP